VYDKEKSYIEKLDTLFQFYEAPLLERSRTSDMIFDHDQVTLMFRDIRSIKEAHAYILERLAKKVMHWKPYYQIASVFPDMRKTFRSSYEAYTNNYSNITVLVRLANENPKIGAFLAACKANSKLKLTIQDILIMPIQQFPHYLTLVRTYSPHALLSECLSHPCDRYFTC